MKSIANWIAMGSPASLRAVIGKGCLLWGCKRERVREYLEVLEWGGLVDVNEKEDSITWVGK